MTQVGPEIPAGSAEYQQVAAIIRSVERLTGRASRWNGRLYEEPRADAVGAAHLDGSMTLSRTHVLEPLRLAAEAGRPLAKDEVDQVKDAVLTVVHEGKHLVDTLGDENAPGAVPLYEADEKALDEGLVETWTHRNADAVIQDVGLDVAVPGLLDAEIVDSYPAHTTGSDALLQGISDITGVAPDHVRRHIEDTGRAQRWAAVADLVIDHRFADVMPPEHRDAVQAQLMQAARIEYADLYPLQQSKLETDVGKTLQAHQIGRRATTALSTTASSIENHYRDWHRRRAIEQQAAADPEVDHLRKFLGGQAPAAAAGTASQHDQGAAPDNVRQLRPTRGHGIQ
jgi:hypothetical protein